MLVRGSRNIYVLGRVSSFVVAARSQGLGKIALAFLPGRRKNNANERNLNSEESSVVRLLIHNFEGWTASAAVALFGRITPW